MLIVLFKNMIDKLNQNNAASFFFKHQKLIIHL